MSERVIYKYRFTSTSEFVLEVPWTTTSVVRHVGSQYVNDTAPTIWIEHDITQLEVPPDAVCRRFWFQPTGLPFDADSDEFLGTAVCANGHLVWHVFGKQPTG